MGTDGSIVAMERHRTGARCFVLAVALAILAVCLLWGAKDNYVRLAASGLSALGAIWLARMGTRRRIPVFTDATAVLDYAESRDLPLGLYLRSFAVDERIDHPLQELLPSASAEEDLAVLLGDQCLLVALGRPGEELPARGAYRMYIPDENWQDAVASLLARAEVIVFRWAGTGAVEWELEQIVAHQKLERTVFVLPPGETSAELRPFLPPELHERLDPDLHLPARENVFATLFNVNGDGVGRLHDLPKEDGEEAAEKLMSQVFGLPDLDRKQRRSIRALYNPVERFALTLLRAAFTVFSVIVLLGMIVFLDIVTVQFFADQLPLENLLTPAGFTMLICLAVIGLCSLVLSRSIGRT